MFKIYIKTPITISLLNYATLHISHNVCTHWMYQYYVLYLAWWWLSEPKHVAEFLILITNICCAYWLNKFTILLQIKTGWLLSKYKVTQRRVLVTIFATICKKYCTFWACVYRLRYPARKAHAPYYVMCGLCTKYC